MSPSLAVYRPVVRFRLNGRDYDLDERTARIRIEATIPDPLQVHWVEIDGRRWPPRQAFEVATTISRAEFTSHIALRNLRKLGFQTSDFGSTGAAPTDRHAAIPPESSRSATPQAAATAFTALDSFLQSAPFTGMVAALEAALIGADRKASMAVALESPFNSALIENALIVRERIGVFDSVIHASVITQVIPLILDEGEHLTKRPSLGAGNDNDRLYDLETDRRLAEFKLSSWKGSDGMRQRGLFADVVGLSLDTSDRRKQVFVVGDLPVKFLTTSRRNAAKTLSKAAMRLRIPDLLDNTITVSQFTKASGVEVIDLTTLLPGLRGEEPVWRYQGDPPPG